jgi:uncharacterized membrane protein
MLDKALSVSGILYRIRNSLKLGCRVEDMLRKIIVIVPFVLALLFFSGTSVSAQENTAVIHGATYDWFTLEPMSDVIVEVNTTPKQTMVADNGEYSFSVPSGDYTIGASYYERSSLIYYDEENVSVTAGGDYRIDLILLPTIDDNEIPEVQDVEEFDETTNWTIIGAVLGITAAVGVTALYFIRKKPKSVTAHPTKIICLPPDLEGVINTIREGGGRMNQVELRKKIPYSEAKVSLMVSDLEDRGLVRRIKKGRGNIIVLTEMG